jgi:hypothetical protein
MHLRQRSTWAAPLAALVVACGGKAVVDQGAGSGGAGAAGATAGSSAEASSVASGPTCGCSEHCSILQSCGFACPVPCEGTVEQLQCVCDAGFDCSSVGACIGGTPPPDPGAPTDACIQCFQAANAGPCLPEYDACVADASCTALFQCEVGCDFTYDCLTGCSQRFPDGAGLLAALVGCSV